MHLMKNKVDLINRKYGSEFKQHILRQYEMFVESSEKISLKRMSSNKFYVGLNSAIFAIAGYLSLLPNNLIAVVLSFIGIIMCLSWISNISSYKKLNSAKFKVIFELEEHMPARLFTKEDSNLNGYYSLTKIEKFVPVLFIILYSIVITILLPNIIISLVGGLR